MKHQGLAVALLLLNAVVLTGCGGDAPTPQPTTRAVQEEGQDEHGSEGAAEETHADVVKLTPEARVAAGIVVAPAGPATISELLPLYGVIKPNAEAVRSVTARFPGLVLSISARVGDTVRKGTTLAMVESNESLQVYPVASPLGGVVTERFTNEGEQAGTQPLFTVADLSTLWAELSLFPRDRSRIRLGQAVNIHVPDGGLSGIGKVVFIAPLGSSDTQSLTARVLLPNADAKWAPGLYVSGDVSVAETKVSIAVPVDAVLEVEGRTSVFVEDSDGLEPRVVRTGRSDGKYIEILEGLEAGESVVVQGSFVLKAELGKGSAEHGH